MEILYVQVLCFTQKQIQIVHFILKINRNRIIFMHSIDFIYAFKKTHLKLEKCEFV